MTQHPADQQSAAWKAGLARRIITPDQPMHMAGFASRNRPSDGVLHDLWTKALALEDNEGNRVVLICTDIIGLTGEFCDEVGARVQERWGVPRENLVFNASHTHSGPILSGVLEMMWDLPEEHETRIHEYTARLKDTVTEVIGEALQTLEPAQLSFGRGTMMFAVNRREQTPDGVINRYNPTGPSDFEVPVLQVTAPDGTVRAILCGYACHTTTLGIYQFSGDYAGFAQMDLEEKYPGAQAMFMMLCGADQNALPRGKVAQAQTYGAHLATAVVRGLAGPMQPLNGPLRIAYETISLELQPHTRETFEERIGKDDLRNPFYERHAKIMVGHYDTGTPIREIDYPVQAISFGNDCTLLVLSGEVVVDYSLRAKRELRIENLIVAGYSNGIAAYIPSQRVLREGGYEGGDSMIYFGLPTPFADDVEERIFAAIGRVVTAAGNDKDEQKAL